MSKPLMERVNAMLHALEFSECNEGDSYCPCCGQQWSPELKHLGICELSALIEETSKPHPDTVRLDELEKRGGTIMRSNDAIMDGKTWLVTAHSRPRMRGYFLTLREAIDAMKEAQP